MRHGKDLRHGDGVALTALTVSRKPGETIDLVTRHGEEITIELASVNGQRVRLRAIASPTTRILRGELTLRQRRQALAAEKLAAAGSGAPQVDQASVAIDPAA
ncbi:MAG TPA: carbon storage regulator [Pirellulales bacterium]|jgi:sRNA-binding carbon storage regulator CsrA|nr:carbon storage regulator [Pirellulales bacterium]